MRIQIILLLLLTNFLAFAQNQNSGKISGKLVIESGSKEILVSLFNQENNGLIKTEISNSDGTFLFENLDFGNYYILIDEPNFTLFQSATIELTDQNLNLQLGNIALKSTKTEQLQEVVVARKKPIVEQKLDKTVVNVEAMQSAAGGDAIDVLEKSPGIQIDQNGSITYKGRTGVAVFIDGKPTYLSGSDLQAYLKSLPAETLNQIELMSNPPAQYDAAGSGGVINITTKKRKIKGFQAGISSRITTGKANRARHGLNATYHNERFKIFGNISGEQTQTYNHLTINREFKNDDNQIRNYFIQQSILENNIKSFNGLLGMDIYLSDKTTLGWNASGIHRSNRSSSAVNSDIFDAAWQLDSVVSANNRVKDKFQNATFGINLRHDFSQSSKLTADADYLKYDTSANQTFVNRMFQADGNLSGSDQLVGSLPSDIQIFSFKTDYSKSFENGYSLAVGAKISQSKTDNIADYRDVISGNEVPNYDRTNHFKYDENISAAYVNLSKDWKQFSAQLGLRAENTVSKGHQLGNILKPEARFSRDYFHLFPTVYLQYKLDTIGNNTIGTSYGKRISRPIYQDLNPFISPLDKFTFYSGNPYLQPSLSHVMNLTYAYKSFFSSTAEYSLNKEEINETIQIVDGIYYSAPGNIGKSQYYTWTTNSQIPLTSFWDFNLYTELTHTRYESDLYDTQLKTSGTFYALSSTQTFKFPKSWSAELTGNYISEVESAQFTMQRRGSMNIGITKKLWENKGTIRLIGNDIFNSNIYRGVINNLNQTNAGWTNRPYSRMVSLVFSYQFGSLNTKKESYNNSGADEEKNRVKG